MCDTMYQLQEQTFRKLKWDIIINASNKVLSLHAATQHSLHVHGPSWSKWQGKKERGGTYHINMS